MKPIPLDDDWDDFYNETEVEDLPWFTKRLDFDLQIELKNRNLRSGRFLDLGTGIGTQAIALSNMGFDVTGADISEVAIEKAKKRSDKINFVVDDILNTKLPDDSFDFIFDRGIFHLFDESDRTEFVNQIKRILNDDGIYFLKCMSIEEEEFSGDNAPHRLSKQQIIDIFGNDFDIEKIKPSIFEASNLDYNPRAWFAVMQKKT
ncbi:MAG: methyltransferase domain-containing protein [Nitrosopumilaceae archaeon]|nr:class I SAM-dependent methyltransferase [Nitrosopumilaceae archaeon]NIU86773.1 methyltransferase domain-containing protein [Nitrosopumilaceae archaeon]NIV65473.1 methyltransferase domain-containing protein [Nitrosopumilaceae archaeon]